MSPERRRAFAQKWINDRETIFSEESDEPPSPPLSKTRPRTSIYNYILDGRIRIEPVGYARWLEQQRLWLIWGYRWNRFAKQWSELTLFYCRQFELEDDPTI